MSSDPVEALKARLPAQVLERVASLRLNEARAILVLDASGLDAAARSKLEEQARAALQDTPGVTELHVAMTAERGSDAPRKPRIIAVGSGKGGVGKSTVSTNLAVALQRAGHRVGVVDADIYGPSQSRLLGTEGQRPIARDKQLIPVQSRWGVPVLSMAHLAEPGQAIAWRGPMAGNALVQMLEGDWTDVDVLIVDLPPGTGDIQLTMLQRFKPDGAVIVSTPQDLALIDATRAIGLFDKGGVPVIGLIENMAGYACPHCGEVSDPFGHGGAEATALSGDHPFLGRIPLDIVIRQESDAGTPPAAGDGPQAEAFVRIAQRVAAWLEKR
ncbi:ATP-binding protein involved in chromosome partitioning [Novosphingobium chloroacetimidivorans]|uniref:Iron-sulfur cluster carrier protein n=1 Tax=Novosphingobium chloroacetimidivorans TaxID=1428314 RepID=A0A7W7K9N3_9SPHN|nr:Mrp/NBP35 family ATP-binding protein [Novosphingobium chloroacetimidivorans]MBB4858078.1 ATP-binding protein involved in chromosome partitioning [Novosphingobium chloroacetimidivorans]